MSYRLLLPSAVLAIVLPACGGGGGSSSGNTPVTPPPPPTPQNTVVEVVVDEFSYSPKQLEIEPGTTVRFIHRGGDPNHTATAMDRFDSGFSFRNPGDTFEVTFNDADDGQTFEYSCVSHKDCCMMQGSIRVGANAPDPSPGY